jgi:hypothetical protein
MKKIKCSPDSVVFQNQIKKVFSRGRGVLFIEENIQREIFAIFTSFFVRSEFLMGYEFGRSELVGTWSNEGDVY